MGCFVRVGCGCVVICYSNSLNYFFFSYCTALVSGVDDCGIVFLFLPCWQPVHSYVSVILWIFFPFLYGRRRLSLMLGRGFGSCDASCWPFCAGSLFLHVSLSLYAWVWMCVAFGKWLACWLVLVGTTWFPGSFVLDVSFLLYWRCDSDADGRCPCCSL